MEITRCSDQRDRLTPEDIVYQGSGITEAVQRRLLAVGANPWFLRRACLIEDAIFDVTETVASVDVPYTLRQQAYQELDVLIDGLGRLVYGGVNLHKTATRREGYYFSGDGEKRIVVRLSGTTNDADQPVKPGITIDIKDIIGKSSRGGAIAGDDSEISFGLKYLEDENIWIVSIYSGLRDKGHWRMIRPLSQAIMGYPRKFEANGNARPAAKMIKDSGTHRFVQQDEVGVNSYLSGVFVNNLASVLG